MEFRQVVERRTSVRRYKNESVPLEDLFEMVRLAGLSPSINNSQPWKFIVITNRLLLAEMAEVVQEQLDQLFGQANPQTDAIKETVAYYTTFFKNAPSLIAVAMSSYEATIDKAFDSSVISHEQLNALRQYPDIQSIGACIQTLLLAAVDMGYGACWLSGLMVARKKLEALLHIERPWQLAAFVSVGKPASAAKPRQKKPLSEILELID